MYAMNLINLADYKPLSKKRINKRKWTSLLLVIILFAVTLLLSGMTAVAQSHMASHVSPWGLEPADVPNPEALSGWLDLGYETDRRDLDGLLRAEIPGSCDQSTLYPAHPQQTSKQYHVFRAAHFTGSKLRADARACKRSGKSKSRCLETYPLHYGIISDLFQDACGNMYRAFWKITYFYPSEESMGTLSSKGRTLYSPPKPMSENDQYVGPTFPVARDEFIFLTPAFEGDIDALANGLANSKKTHQYDPATHLFKYVGPFR
jgi:hypothetical protein